MNIDDGLEKLPERHKALTQTVEVIAGMQRENERQIEALVGAIGHLVHVVENLSRRRRRPH